MPHLPVHEILLLFKGEFGFHVQMQHGEFKKEHGKIEKP